MGAQHPTLEPTRRVGGERRVAVWLLKSLPRALLAVRGRTIRDVSAMSRAHKKLKAHARAFGLRAEALGANDFQRSHATAPSMGST